MATNYIILNGKFEFNKGDEVTIITKDNTVPSRYKVLDTDTSITNETKLYINIDTSITNVPFTIDYLRLVSRFRKSNWKSGIWTNGVYETGLWEGGLWYNGIFTGNWM